MSFQKTKDFKPGMLLNPLCRRNIILGNLKREVMGISVFKYPEVVDFSKSPNNYPINERADLTARQVIPFNEFVMFLHYLNKKHPFNSKRKGCVVLWNNRKWLFFATDLKKPCQT